MKTIYLHTECKGSKVMNKYNYLSKGQTVWVRSLQDIFDTLDDNAKLDGLPFMPEMARYCGHSYQVSCLPTKTCVEGVGFRSMANIVFLENLRCDGSSHDGCQRECLLFWHDAWLSDNKHEISSAQQDELGQLADKRLKTRQAGLYICQSTELGGATSPYHEKKYSLRQKFSQYLASVRSGEMSALELINKVIMAVLYRLGSVIGIDTSGEIRGRNQKTESLSLGLQSGDWVEVKNRKEIEETLDIEGKNRGLLFDPPMAEYCGQRFQVANRLENIILEETGKMISLQNTVILKGNTCKAWGCPRDNLHYWREIWLRRIASIPDQN